MAQRRQMSIPEAHPRSSRAGGSRCMSPPHLTLPSSPPSHTAHHVCRLLPSFFLLPQPKKPGVPITAPSTAHTIMVAPVRVIPSVSNHATQLTHTALASYLQNNARNRLRSGQPAFFAQFNTHTRRRVPVTQILAITRLPRLLFPGLESLVAGDMPPQPLLTRS